MLCGKKRVKRGRGSGDEASRPDREAVELPEAQHAAWYQMLRAQAAVTRQIDRRLSRAGQIPLGWYDVLVSLEKAAGHRLRLAELAEAVVLSRSGLSRLVDRLEEAGLLRRESCCGDRRGAFAVLTEAGQEARLAAWAEHSRGISEMFARHLSDEEAAVVAQALGRVADAALEHPKGDAEGACGGERERTGEKGCPST